MLRLFRAVPSEPSLFCSKLSVVPVPHHKVVPVPTTLVFFFFANFSTISIQYDSFGPLLRRGPAETTCSASSRFVSFLYMAFTQRYSRRVPTIDWLSHLVFEVTSAVKWHVKLNHEHRAVPFRDFSLCFTASFWLDDLTTSGENEPWLPCPPPLRYGRRESYQKWRQCDVCY